jgi:hypothetical protein
MMVRQVLVVMLIGCWAGLVMAQTEPPPAPPAAPAPSAAQDTAPAAPAPAATAPASPKAALQQLNIAMQSGDAQAIRALLWARTEEEQQLAEAVIDLSEAVVKLRQAATDAYGQEGARPLVGRADLDKASATIAAAQEEIMGDMAMVDMGVGQQVFLVLEDGRWMVPIAAVTEGLTEANMVQRTQEIRLRARLFRETAAEIAEGRHKDAEAAAEALRTRVMRPAITQPADAPTPPNDQATPPADPATAPADQATPPADQATPPADQATPPADQAAPPADPATPPNDPAAPPADQAPPPVVPDAQPAPQATEPPAPQATEPPAPQAADPATQPVEQ